MIEDIKTSGDYSSRLSALQTYNAENRWKKRGMSVVPMRYDHRFGYSVKFHCLISICSVDGSVAVTHGGIEMGQGNVKK